MPTPGERPRGLDDAVDGLPPRRHRLRRRSVESRRTGRLRGGTPGDLMVHGGVTHDAVRQQLRPRRWVADGAPTRTTDASSRQRCGKPASTRPPVGGAPGQAEHRAPLAAVVRATAGPARRVACGTSARRPGHRRRCPRVSRVGARRTARLAPPHRGRRRWRAHAVASGAAAARDAASTRDGQAEAAKALVDLGPRRRHPDRLVPSRRAELTSSPAGRGPAVRRRSAPVAATPRRPAAPRPRDGPAGGEALRTSAPGSAGLTRPGICRSTASAVTDVERAGGHGAGPCTGKSVVELKITTARPALEDADRLPHLEDAARHRRRPAGGRAGDGGGHHGRGPWSTGDPDSSCTTGWWRASSPEQATRRPTARRCPCVAPGHDSRRRATIDRGCTVTRVRTARWRVDLPAPSSSCVGCWAREGGWRHAAGSTTACVRAVVALASRPPDPASA